MVVKKKVPGDEPGDLLFVSANYHFFFFFFGTLGCDVWGAFAFFPFDFAGGVVDVVSAGFVAGGVASAGSACVIDVAGGVTSVIGISGVATSTVFVKSFATGVAAPGTVTTITFLTSLALF